MRRPRLLDLFLGALLLGIVPERRKKRPAKPTTQLPLEGVTPNE